MVYLADGMDPNDPFIISALGWVHHVDWYRQPQWHHDDFSLPALDASGGDALWERDDHSRELGTACTGNDDCDDQLYRIGAVAVWLRRTRERDTISAFDCAVWRDAGIDDPRSVGNTGSFLLVRIKWDKRFGQIEFVDLQRVLVESILVGKIAQCVNINDSCVNCGNPWWLGKRFL